MKTLFDTLKHALDLQTDFRQHHVVSKKQHALVPGSFSESEGLESCLVSDALVGGSA